MGKVSLSMEKVAEMMKELELARSSVYVAAAGLADGDSDLDQLASKMLSGVFQTITTVSDDLLMLARDAEA